MALMEEMTIVEERGPSREADTHAAMPWLVLWTALTILILAGLWRAGFKTSGLVAAVDAGAARVEARATGETGDDLIRKTIKVQRDTLPFWTVLALIGDFLAEPLALMTRALAAATAFSAIAALRGRAVRFERALADCAMVQGVWVLGLAVRAGLMVVLRRSDVETSATLFLAPGTYSAITWLMLGQLDAFALFGWSLIGWDAVRRRQVRWIGALLVCSTLFVSESMTRAGLSTLLGAGMRLSVVTSPG